MKLSRPNDPGFLEIKPVLINRFKEKGKVFDWLFLLYQSNEGIEMPFGKGYAMRKLLCVP
jgi:hypothetical protein